MPRMKTRAVQRVRLLQRKKSTLLTIFKTLFALILQLAAHTRKATAKFTVFITPSLSHRIPLLGKSLPSPGGMYLLLLSASPLFPSKVHSDLPAYSFGL